MSWSPFRCSLRAARWLAPCRFIGRSKAPCKTRQRPVARFCIVAPTGSSAAGGSVVGRSIASPSSSTAAVRVGRARTGSIGDSRAGSCIGVLRTTASTAEGAGATNPLTVPVRTHRPSARDHSHIRRCWRVRSGPFGVWAPTAFQCPNPPTSSVIFRHPQGEPSAAIAVIPLNHADSRLPSESTSPWFAIRRSGVRVPLAPSRGLLGAVSGANRAPTRHPRSSSGAHWSIREVIRRPRSSLSSCSQLGTSGRDRRRRCLRSARWPTRSQVTVRSASGLPSRA